MGVQQDTIKRYINASFIHADYATQTIFFEQKLQKKMDSICTYCGFMISPSYFQYLQAPIFIGYYKISIERMQFIHLTPMSIFLV